MINEDLNTLFNLMFSHALDRVSTCGKFNPCCVSMDKVGGIEPCVAKRTGKNPLTSRYVVSMHKKLHRQAQAGDVRALGFCCTFHESPGLSENERVMLFVLEHKNGEAMELQLPYLIDAAEPSVTLGFLRAKARECGFFPAL
jgi:hypothetical protein